MQKVFTQIIILLRIFYHRILSPDCMNDFYPNDIKRYPDFLYDIIYANKKFINVLPNSIKINTHSFLYEAGMYYTINIIKGTEEIYNPPKTRI